MIEISKDNWNEITSSKDYTLVEVYSPTCVPCKLVSRELLELEKVNPIKVGKVTATTLQEVDKDLFSKLEGVPTILLVRENEVITLPKVYSRKQIEEQLQKYVGGEHNGI